MEDDLSVFADRAGWSVEAGVATYWPVPHTWRAEVRRAVTAARAFERFHVAIINPDGGRCRHAQGVNSRRRHAPRRRQRQRQAPGVVSRAMAMTDDQIAPGLHLDCTLCWTSICSAHGPVPQSTVVRVLLSNYRWLALRYEEARKALTRFLPCDDDTELHVLVDTARVLIVATDRERDLRRTVYERDAQIAALRTELAALLSPETTELIAAAEQLVDDWDNDRSTHGGLLQQAVRRRREAAAA